jgi:hypothetical protein
MKKYNLSVVAFVAVVSTYPAFAADPSSDTGSKNVGQSSPGKEVLQVPGDDIFGFESELLKLRFRIWYADLPFREIGEARVAWSHQIDSDFDRALLLAEKEDAGTSGDQPKQSLKLYKAQMKLYFARDSFERDVDAYAYIFGPNCSVANTLLTALGYRPTIVVARTSPLLSIEASGFKNIFINQIKEIDELQAAVSTIHAEEAKQKQ